MEQELMKSARFDEPDSLEIIDIWVEPEILQCRVCGVALSNADELRLAGIPPRLEFTQNGTPWGLITLSAPPDDFYDEGPWTAD
ncbi:hypothetical protein AB0H37_38085 [Actinomadura sp. NPDC023710]|uniref:hypothetical protein n=1 Tax=Actinomadura sp. NPDC023710 TaxID=3158219 RepID=UPI0033EBC62F